MLIPCCLVWDGVKLELELELELAGLGCSDFKEEKGTINIFYGTSLYLVLKIILFLKKYHVQQKQPYATQEK